jgi:ATP-dependent DNA ligase
LIAFYQECIADGIEADGTLNGRGEGLIIKRLDGLYVWERSEVVRSGRGKNATIVKGYEWVKWKPVLDLDLKIVGYELGKGRLAKTVGKLLLEGYDENGTFVRARCGSGLNDKMRAAMIADFSKFMGKTAMIECQEISIGKDSNVHSARFPVFCKIRDDK